MPYFVIYDSTANLVDSFRREPDARRALGLIVEQDPGSAGDYAMITHDDDGYPVGAALTGAQLNASG
jgi:hypothetical protein